ncbi:MAG TPA: response regulator [Edaphobacter sp.]|jgi:DNA-binding response OmpR family regulator|nr:response regulator [Edaphobacter sp.]
MHLESQEPRSFASPTILVVDDDPDIRSLTRTFLEHEGYHVYTSGDADRAAKIFRRAPKIDLLITDYSMPHRSGMDLARELKLICPSLPILLISGVFLASGQLDQMQTQGWSFLAKPFSLPLLLARVHNILQPIRPSDISATLGQ